MPSLALNANETATKGIRRVALAALDDALERLKRPGVAAADIHEARKRIKEVRAIVRLTDAGKPLRMTLRDAARHLSSSRDADAIVESFDKLRKRFEERRFAKIRRALVNRGSAPSGASSAVSSLRRLRPRIAALNAGKTLDDGLLKTYRNARRALRTAAATRDPADFHEWRKRVKDHWYQTQLIEASSPAILGGHAEALHDLSRLLGDHHDLIVLRGTLRDRDDIASLRLLRAFDALIAARLFELEEEAENLGRHVLAEKPRVWLRRIRAYWKLWRRETDPLDP